MDGTVGLWSAVLLGSGPAAARVGRAAPPGADAAQRTGAARELQAVERQIVEIVEIVELPAVAARKSLRRCHLLGQQMRVAGVARRLPHIRLPPPSHTHAHAHVHVHVHVVTASTT